MIRIASLRPGGNDPFPSVETALDEPNGLLAAGGDLSVDRLLDAYRHGIFPWFSQGQPILWWSPDPRTVFATSDVHISTTLRRSLRRCNWTIRADTAFEPVMRCCAAPRPGQPTTWITRQMLAAYCRLHALGHAHSVEVYDDDLLVGGIYGVAVGRMFFGESMFSARSDGSKAALVALCRGLRRWDFPWLDAQVESGHLMSMGAIERRRSEFICDIAQLTDMPGIPGSWTERWPIASARALVE